MEPLGKLEHVDPRKLWNREAQDFTPWIKENIAVLGEALGLDLELPSTEVPVGDFACDIGARETGSNRTVIIENQLESTDHRHLGQLLTYAGGLDAAVIVWISPEIREEHRQALDWLNRHTEKDIDFFGVVVEAIRIDDSKPAVQFRPVAFPNTWSKTGPPVISERGQLYREFFQPLLDELREKHKFTNARAAQPMSWYAFRSGVNGCHLTAAFANGQRLRSEVYIDTGDYERNKSIFDFLLSDKDAIQTELSEELDWERLDERRACRIAAVRHSTSIGDAAVHDVPQ